MATKLWDYLYSIEENKNKKINGMDTNGNNLIRGLIDSASLMDYYALDSVSIDKKTQKEKLCQYALLTIMNQVENATKILLQCGIKTSEQELLKLLTVQMKDKKNTSQIGVSDIKKRFQKEREDYLSKANQYL